MSLIPVYKEEMFMMDFLPSKIFSINDFKQKLADFYGVAKENISFVFYKDIKDFVEVIKINNNGVFELINRESLSLSKFLELGEKEFIDDIEIVDDEISFQICIPNKDVKKGRECHFKNKERFFQISRKILKQKLADFYGVDVKNVEIKGNSEYLNFRVLKKGVGFIEPKEVNEILNKDIKIDLSNMEIIAIANDKLTIIKE